MNSVLHKPTKPFWVQQFLHQKFESSGVMTPDAVKWMANSKEWFDSFVKRVKAVEAKFNKGHYYWFAFIKIGDQWWYFNTSDVRFKTMRSLLVRTARSDKDYTGGLNQYVEFGNDNFEESLMKLMGIEP